MNFAYKAYDTLHVFKSKSKAIDAAEKWAAATEGSEQARACRVIAGFKAGKSFVDTDLEIKAKVAKLAEEAKNDEYQETQADK